MKFVAVCVRLKISSKIFYLVRRCFTLAGVYEVGRGGTWGGKAVAASCRSILFTDPRLKVDETRAHDNLSETGSSVNEESSLSLLTSHGFLDKKGLISLVINRLFYSCGLSSLSFE